MGAVYDDLPDHEGYAAEDDGRHVAACSCGWHDDASGSTSDYEAAIDRRDQQHATELLRRAVPGEIASLVDDIRRAVANLARTRPQAAGIVLDQLDRTVTQLRQRAQDVDRGVPTVGQRLQAFGAARSRRLGIER